MMNMNEIKISNPLEFNEKLIRYIANNAITYNLLVMASEVPETDYKHSFLQLKKSFSEKLEGLSDSDRDNLSKVSSIIRFKDRKKNTMRGLMVTFGKTPSQQAYESTFKKEVNDFINALNDQYGHSLIERVSMPIVRLALLVHALRTNFSCDLSDLSRQEYAMLNMESNHFRYSLPGSKWQYVVNLSQNNWRSSSFYLRVRRPRSQVAGPEKLAKAFVFHDKATGFDFLETSGLKLKVNKNASKAPYVKTQVASKSIDENFSSLSDVISCHEAYWNSILMDLLDKAGIEHTYAQFTPDSDLHIKKEYVSYMSMSDDWVGMGLNKILENCNGVLNYYVDQTQGIDPEKLVDSVGYLLSMNDDPDFQGAIPVKFKPVSTLDEADIVLGGFDPEADRAWLSAPSSASLDMYGEYRRRSLQQNHFNTKQFVDYMKLNSEKSARVILKRVTIECLMKRWASNKQFSANCPLDAEKVGDGKREFIVLSTNKKKVKGESSKSRHNVYTVMYGGSLEDNNFTFSGLGVATDLEMLTRGHGFEGFLANRMHALPLAERLLDLLDDKNADSLAEDLEETFFNSDALYIFEHSEARLTHVWKSTYDDLWIIPALKYRYPEEGTFESFVRSRIEESAFVKKKGVSQIDNEIKRSKDPHYQVSLQGKSLYIRRLISNPSLEGGGARTMVRRIESLYPLNDIAIGDASLILSGLLPDTLTQAKDSGASQTLFEKISKLAVSD